MTASSSDNNPLGSFTSILGGAAAPSETPDQTAMIHAALKMLRGSDAGSKLVSFAIEERLEVKVIRTRHETAYLPQSKEIFIGLSANMQPSPSRFVLLLAGALREAQQEHEGMTRPDLNQSINDIVRISSAREADKVAYLCLIGYELDQNPALAKHRFLDELRSMGYGEIVDIFLKNL